VNDRSIHLDKIINCQFVFINEPLHTWNVENAMVTPVHIGMIFGDPYIITLDGLQYELSTIGEFTLASDNVMTTQIRHASAGVNLGTVNDAVAIKYNSYIIIIQRSNVMPQLFLNSNIPTNHTPNSKFVLTDTSYVGLLFVSTFNNTITYNVYFNKTGHQIYVIIRKNKNNIQYLSVIVSFPKNSMGKIKGLLGNYDGDMTNDLTCANGTTLNHANYTHGQLYFDFAYSHRVTNSLFGTNTYQNITNASFTQTDLSYARYICINSTNTNKCMYDVLTSNDVAFAIDDTEFNYMVYDDVIRNFDISVQTMNANTQTSDAVIGLSIALGILTIKTLVLIGIIVKCIMDNKTV